MIDLSNESFDTEYDGYYACANGVDRDGNECMFVVRYDPWASGCNPYYWDASSYNRKGHEFLNLREAVQQTKHASMSWTVKSVDLSSAWIERISVRNLRQYTLLGSTKLDLV